MKFRRVGLAAAVAAATLLLGACDPSGGGGGGTPTPTPTPSPTPTPTPTPSALQALAVQPPVPVYFAMLLTDGSVLAQAEPNASAGVSAGDYYRLTPDQNGDYARAPGAKLRRRRRATRHGLQPNPSYRTAASS
ncbi:MAG: hypothetical protein ACJ8FS_08425 [Sphingomicrobium sp.]